MRTQIRMYRLLSLVPFLMLWLTLYPESAKAQFSGGQWTADDQNRCEQDRCQRNARECVANCTGPDVCTNSGCYVCAKKCELQWGTCMKKIDPNFNFYLGCFFKFGAYVPASGTPTTGTDR